MTLAELWDLLDKHDWFHAMSDDHSVWVRGHSNEQRLRGHAHSIEGGEQLFRAFNDYVCSGRAWGNEEKPKPPRPA